MDIGYIIFGKLSGDWVCRVYRYTWHIIGHFGDESFQIVSCTGTDNQTVMKMHFRATDLYIL